MRRQDFIVLVGGAAASMAAPAGARAASTPIASGTG